jgi:hypothetical protein
MDARGRGGGGVLPLGAFTATLLGEDAASTCVIHALRFWWADSTA